LPVVGREEIIESLVFAVGGIAIAE